MTMEKRMWLGQKIDAGIKAGVAAALEEHRRAGRKVAIWRDGKVQLVLPPPPDDESGALRETCGDENPGKGAY